MTEDETKDRTRSIVDGGEAQFVVHLARRDGAEVFSPEPDRLWEANKLAKEFGREAVAFYYFIRQIGWWHRFTEMPNLQTESDKMLELMKSAYNWEDMDFSVEKMEALHQELFGKPLPWDDAQWVYNVTTPSSDQYVMNSLARRSGELRDNYLLDQIITYWRAGRSPFLIFGSSHAICLEPALKVDLLQTS